MIEIIEVLHKCISCNVIVVIPSSLSSSSSCLFINKVIIRNLNVKFIATDVGLSMKNSIEAKSMHNWDHCKAEDR